jgi:hypothetical protein
VAKTISVVKPTTFAELLEAVESFQAASDVSWYRGSRNKAHSLKPSLYRHSHKTAISDLIDLETEVTTRFVQRSLPFLERSLTDDWDKLFLMQHYGVPTRLLDWSENPFVSIYFALVSASEPKSTDAAIWMCDPVAWNQAALDHISYKGGVLDQSHAAMRTYAPGTKVDEIPTLPVMIYGSYNSPRIVAQRGGFALFGQGLDPMDKVFKADKFPEGILTKIEIGHAYVDEIRASLFRKGFTESVVFPDLDGLSKELRRIYSF